MTARNGRRYFTKAPNTAGSVQPRIAEKLTVPNSSFCLGSLERRKYPNMAPPTAISEMVQAARNKGSYPISARNAMTTGMMKFPAPIMIRKGWMAA